MEDLPDYEKDNFPGSMVGENPFPEQTLDPEFDRDSENAQQDSPQELPEVKEQTNQPEVQVSTPEPTSSSISKSQTPVYSNVRKYAHEEPDEESWKQHKKHIFILTSAGKPVYSRYGDESKLSGLVGVLQAIVSFAEDSKDSIRVICAGDHKIVFYLQGPLYLVSASKTGEPVSQLVQQLYYAHNQIVSTLTSAMINKIFQARGNYDLRNLLSGTEKFLDSMFRYMSRDYSFLSKSVHYLPLAQNIRNTVGNILKSCRTLNTAFSILLAGYQLVNMVRPLKHYLHPADLHLIINFVNTSTSFKSLESWTPICLPQFNDRGSMHAYVCYIAEDLCLLLISTQPEDFYELAECKTQIVEALTNANAFEPILSSLKRGNWRLKNIPNVSQILHFIYKTNAGQMVTCALDVPYHTKVQQKKLFRLYQNCYNRVYLAKERPLSIYYHITGNETILIWHSPGFELLASFSALITHAQAIRHSNSLLRWIKEQENELFNLQAHTFAT